MADVNDRYADNVDGSFYVDTQCILCHLCSDIAPGNFKESADGDHDFVHTQPSTDEEIELCLEALEQCPVEAIGSDGPESSGQPAPQVLPFEKLEHVVVFASNDDVESESQQVMENCQPILETMTGKSMSEIGEKARFQMFGKSSDTIRHAKKHGGLGIVAATELGLAIGDENLPLRYSAGAFKATERHFQDPKTGHECQIVLLYGNET